MHHTSAESYQPKNCCYFLGGKRVSGQIFPEQRGIRRFCWKILREQFGKSSIATVRGLQNLNSRLYFTVHLCPSPSQEQSFPSSHILSKHPEVLSPLTLFSELPPREVSAWILIRPFKFFKFKKGQEIQC